jgi:hypothetical protein
METPQDVVEFDASGDDPASIEAELDQLEALVRAANDAELPSATSSPMRSQW